MTDVFDRQQTPARRTHGDALRARFRYSALRRGEHLAIRRTIAGRRMAAEDVDAMQLAAVAYIIARRAPKQAGRTLLEMRMEWCLEDELAAALCFASAGR